MSKFKHNKKKNIAFLYEVLVLELTKAVLSKNLSHQKLIKSLIKEHFSRKSLLFRELKIYQNIVDSFNLDLAIAEKILQESKKEYNSINKDALMVEQSKLLFKIKKFLGEKVLTNFVPNYKYLASLSQIFNSDLSAKSRVLLENDIIGFMTSKSEILTENKLVPINNLTIKTFVKNFNEQYSSLLEEQKTLLSKYIISFSDNGLELKTFLNEEIQRLKVELKNTLNNESIKGTEELLSMVKKVLVMLEEFSKKEIDQYLIEQVAKVQNLLKEINTNDT